MLTANPGSGDTDALQAWHARGPDELSHDEKEAAESEVARPDDRSGHGLVTWTGGDGFIVFFLIPYIQSTERGREQQKHIVCLVREPRAWAPKRDQRVRIHWYGDAGWSCMLTTSTTSPLCMHRKAWHGSQGCDAFLPLPSTTADINVALPWSRQVRIHKCCNTQDKG